MINQITSAAPQVIEYGTQDLSTRVVPREAEYLPQHLPKFCLWAQTGPEDDQLMTSAEANRTFGTETFNLRGIYANHVTPFAAGVMGQGNQVIIKRLVPEDAGPESNIVAYLDVLPTQVDDYTRNSDGSIKTDALGQKVVAGQVTGYKVQWVFAARKTVADAQLFGQATQTAGSQSENGVTSTRYPIFEVKASHKGAYNNMLGLRIWAPTLANQATMPTKLMEKYNVYPYYFQVIRKPDELTSPSPVTTLMGDQSVLAVLKPNVFDPLTDAARYLGDTFISSYRNMSDPTYPKTYGDFGSMAIYQNNIDQLVKMFHAAETPFIDGFSDITADTATAGLFNFVTGVSSQNVAYHSFVFVDSADSTRLSQYTNVYAAGGSDGTMDDATHARLSKAEFARYLDPDDQINDLVLHPESIIYDTGYPLDVKQTLCAVIANRKDTFVVLSTFDAVDGTVLSASDEYSLAVALRTRLQMYPESDYFGTEVMRGMIVGFSAKILNSQWTKRVPLSYEVAVKSAAYMGASNGRWTNGKQFDGAPGSVVDYLYDVSITSISATARNRNWSVGLNWVQAYDRRSVFFPALKTVYGDDTSVLNSYFTALAIGQLNKVAHAAWREYSGVSHLTDAQLVERINAYVIAQTQGRFDERFTIVPDAYSTDMDLVRGYSFTLPIRIYADSMKTVMTTYVQAYRASDLTTSN